MEQLSATTSIRLHQVFAEQGASQRAIELLVVAQRNCGNGGPRLWGALGSVMLPGEESISDLRS
jgi:hypothetical protein